MKDSRRRLLKALGASGSMVVATALPNNWSRPVVEAVLLPAHAQTTSPPEPRRSVENFELEATDENGIVLPIREGERITIEASGQVHTNPGGSVPICDEWTDADGIPACPYNDPALNGLPFMALVGEFSGNNFLVGTYFSQVFGSDGSLTLKVNDTDFTDNAGTLTLVVTRG